MKEKSNTTKLIRDKIDIVSNPLSGFPKKKKTTVTALSKTLVLDSTLKEKDLLPYWSKQAKKLSDKLWLPTKTDLPDSDLNLLNGLLRQTVGNSWFSVELRNRRSKSLQMTFLPSFTFSPVGFTASENTVIRSRKIRFYPNAKQREILRRWFGCARYVYNKTIEYLKQPGTKANWMEIKTEIINSLPDWAKEVPYQIKSMAIKEACQAVKNAKIKYKKTGKPQNVKFRSRKKRQDTIYIPKTAVKELGFYVKSIGEIYFSETVGNTKYDCKVMFYQGRYFFVKPEDKPIQTPDNQRISIVSLNPDVSVPSAL
jgi:putative transposase